MLSKWIYILIGNDKTGKTTFQKRLIYTLCSVEYERLDINKVSKINHPYSPTRLKTLFTINRSFQETPKRYSKVDDYFENHFIQSDICILSSHSNHPCIEQIQEMITEGKKRKYNVGGVFFSNADTSDVKQIALLDWDERFTLDNPLIKGETNITKQIDNLAHSFSEMLIRRSRIQ